MQRTIFAVLAAGALAAVAVPPAFAQGDGQITADVPFAFTVENRSFPAGEYVLANVNQSNPNTMELRSEDGRAHILFNTEGPSQSADPSKAEFVFDKVGDQYFLAAVDSMEGAEGGALAKSREEARLESSGVAVEHHRVPLVRALRKVVRP